MSAAIFRLDGRRISAEQAWLMQHGTEIRFQAGDRVVMPDGQAATVHDVHPHPDRQGAFQICHVRPNTVGARAFWLAAFVLRPHRLVQSSL